jgi:hypothetical protein
MVAQPDWRTPDDIARMGAPRLMVGITAGNLDSMLNKLTAQKKIRAEDQYSPGGRTGPAPQPRVDRVFGNLAGRPSRACPRARRHRGLAAAHRPLRLLVGQRAALASCSTPRRPAHLRHGRAPRVGGRPIASRRASPSSALRDVRGTAHVLRKGQWEDIPQSADVSDGGVFLPELRGGARRQARPSRR